MSISNQSDVSQVIRNIELVKRSSNNFQILSQQLSTGKRYSSLRDYGLFVSKIINLQSVISTRESYVKTIDLVSFNVESYQETLNEIDGITRQVFKASGETPPN
ncbi:MAG: hypothetical protein HRT36_05205 [Alphaproteobacteria bacterium]|nr:hypothetical protein [Alphaproteobacteria bacterium]